MTAPDRTTTARAAPLWVVLLITVLGSMGTGAATNGLYFVADQMHGFTRAQNLWLGVVIGATFIPSAFLSGRTVRFFGRRCGLNERAVLVLTLTLLTACCVFAGLVTAPWATWVFAATFAPLTGVLWPVVESFLSGGRRARNLRNATGRFNYAWAGAVFLSYWCMKPLLAWDPATVYFGLASVHALAALSALLLPPFPARHGPGAHKHDHDERARYTRLLACFRLLLMGSYVLNSAMTPILPARFEDLGVAEKSNRVLYVSAWMGARVVAFVVLERWHGWHGRRRTLVWAGVMMAGGFAGVLLAPTVWWAVVALVLLGIGIGTAYAAALYYAMEVGDARVDAGGAHEAMIGIGYAVGPLASLVAVGAGDAGWIPTDRTDQWALASVGLLGVLIAGWIVRRARRPLPPA